MFLASWPGGEGKKEDSTSLCENTASVFFFCFDPSDKVDPFVGWMLSRWKCEEKRVDTANHALRAPGESVELGELENVSPPRIWSRCSFTSFAFSSVPWRRNHGNGGGRTQKGAIEIAVVMAGVVIFSALAQRVKVKRGGPCSPAGPGSVAIVLRQVHRGWTRDVFLPGPIGFLQKE